MYSKEQLEALKVDELKELAASAEIDGFERMRKAELVDALSGDGRSAPEGSGPRRKMYANPNRNGTISVPQGYRCNPIRFRNGRYVTGDPEEIRLLESGLPRGVMFIKEVE